MQKARQDRHGISWANQDHHSYDSPREWCHRCVGVLTAGEWWPVDPARVDALEAAGLIDATQAENFRLHGAIGSHLENLERNDGFKDFNQPGIDGVLRIIDPRRNLVGD